MDPWVPYWDINGDIYGDIKWYKYYNSGTIMDNYGTTLLTHPDTWFIIVYPLNEDWNPNRWLLTTTHVRIILVPFLSYIRWKRHHKDKHILSTNHSKRYQVICSWSVHTLCHAGPLMADFNGRFHWAPGISRFHWPWGFDLKIARAVNATVLPCRFDIQNQKQINKSNVQTVAKHNHRFDL